MSRVAAIDVGTNSVRLLVADPGQPLTTVERVMHVTRLGAGMDAAGRFDGAALDRTVARVGQYAERAAALGATRLRIAATSAVRDAEDRERFGEAVRARSGVTPDVLSGEQEAATAFLGATSAVDGAAPYCVLDIGGGSTEVILGSGRLEASTSRQIGCVRLTERCLPSDPPTAAELAAAAAAVDAELDAAAAAVPVGVAATLVGVAGTVTTLAALHLRLPTYEPERIHGTRLARAEVARLLAELAAVPAAARAELGPMAPGREDVIVAGAVILDRAMRRYGFDEVLVSEADLLDGLALGLLGHPGATPAPGGAT